MDDILGETEQEKTQREALEHPQTPSEKQCNLFDMVGSTSNDQTESPTSVAV